MATELDHRCPICLDAMDDTSYVMPCLHQFCFGCIRRWAESRPTCPLCKRRVTSILHSVRADDSFEELVVRWPAQGRRAPQHQPGAAGQVPAVPTWASAFRQYPAVLRPLLPWLRQELRQQFGADTMEASAALHLVVSGLRIFGLDEGALALRMLSSLQSQTTSFVQRLVVRAVQLCSGEVQHLLGLDASCAATGQEGSPAAARGAAVSPAEAADPGPQASSSIREANVEELPVPSAAALDGNPGQPPSVPALVPIVQEADQEEPGEAVLDPSRTVRERSRRAPQRAPKRRAHTSEASALPAKRPPHRQH